MLYPFFLWSLRASACLVILSVASVMDTREREVPDKVWLVPAPLLASLTAYDILASGREVVPVLLSLILTGLLALLIYYSGLMGGADAKALVLIAISCPLYYSEPLLPSHPVLPLAAFSNSLLLSLSVSASLLAKNVAWRLRGRSLFEGLEGVPVLTKALVLLSGYKMKVRDFLRTRFLFTLEALVEENGSYRRVLVPVVRLTNENESISWVRRALELGLVSEDDHIWVSPGLPMIVFITAGFALALFMGDVLFYLVLGILRTLLPFK